MALNLGPSLQMEEKGKDNNEAHSYSRPCWAGFKEQLMNLRTSFHWDSVIPATFHQVFSIRCGHSRLTRLPAKNWRIAGAVGANNQTVTHHALKYFPLITRTSVLRVPKMINYIFSKTSAAPQWKAIVLATRTRSYVSGFPLRCYDCSTVCVTVIRAA